MGVCNKATVLRWLSLWYSCKAQSKFIASQRSPAACHMHLVAEDHRCLQICTPGSTLKARHVQGSSGAEHGDLARPKLRTY